MIKHNPLSDITKVDETQIPDFDVLLAGFPCQAFSIAGKEVVSMTLGEHCFLM